MSTLTGNRFGGLVGNGKVIAVCLEDQIILIRNPYLRNWSVEYRNNHMAEYNLSLVGNTVEIIENEPGLTQRLLTEDITTRQMIRLVREKLNK